MTYDYSLKDTVAISLSLEAFDYISVAQQLDVFKADQRISKVDFSDLSLSESGTVTFAAKITLVSDLVHWKTSGLTTNTATSTVR